MLKKQKNTKDRSGKHIILGNLIILRLALCLKYTKSSNVGVIKAKAMKDTPPIKKVEKKIHRPNNKKVVEVEETDFKKILLESIYI